MAVHYTPEAPDNKAIREQLEELKKLNTSSSHYNKINLRLSVVILIITTISAIVGIAAFLR